MNCRWFHRSLSIKILWMPLVVFILGLLVPGLVGYRLLQRAADRETHEKAITILTTLESVRRQADEAAEAGSSAPKTDAFSSPGSAMTRQVMDRYDKTAKEVVYQYRHVLSNAASASEASDPSEAKLIAAFDADRSLKQVEDDVLRENVRYRMIAVPILTTEERPAPTHQKGRMVAKPTSKGQVIGASIIYLPTDFPRAQAARTFWTVYAIIGVLAVMCVGLLFWRTRGLITKPVLQLLETSQAIRRGEWAAKFNAQESDEISILSGSFQETTFWLRDRLAKEEKLRSMFQQFIPASVAAKALGKDADKIIAGTKHSVTVVIINIRNFKLLMEHLPPDQTVTTLNEFFTAVSKVIVDHKGVVSKYLGDTVMAIFGMLHGNEDHALQAVRAAIGIPLALQDLYVRLDETYGWQLGIGVGVTTGEPIVGHFGSSVHMEYTVLGEVVVEAHQLEWLTKGVPEEDTILIDETTFRRVMSDVHVLDLGERPGSDGRALHAYAVQGLRSEARRVLAA